MSSTIRHISFTFKQFYNLGAVTFYDRADAEKLFCVISGYIQHYRFVINGSPVPYQRKSSLSSNLWKLSVYAIISHVLWKERTTRTNALEEPSNKIFYRQYDAEMEHY
jgi:hypothetical protein